MDPDEPLSRIAIDRAELSLDWDACAEPWSCRSR